MLAAAGSTTAAAQEPPPSVSVVIHKPPKKVTIRKHFRPDATAAGGRLVWIARQEQKRWGGPSIVGRMSCESSLSSRSTNGTYDGALAFGPIFASMYAKVPRDVRAVIKRKVKRPILASSGGEKPKRVGTVRQHQRIILRGRLPRRASPFHAWAAVRTGQMAAAGRIPSTYWVCVASNGSHYVALSAPPG